MIPKNEVIAYETFGAVGDGVADDLPAIVKAHQYANAHGLAVKSKPDATYHLGARALTAVIATDTDWNTSRFIIDDTKVEDHKAPLFEVRSLLEPEPLRIERLARDQKQVEARPRHDCYVRVEEETTKRYIRRGLNQNAGVPQQDCFILRRDGSIEGDIDWDYQRLSHIEAHPIDQERLVVAGGIFTTFANRMKQEVGYNYWARNIVIRRSNTEIDGVTHYVVGETSVGHPYRGFLNAIGCANITLRDCFVTGHKIYSTIGAAGKPVSMGSYDLHANNVVNLRLIDCRMNHFCDRTRWGVVATNFCKNILLEGCTLSRMDTHMGVSGTYTIRRCHLGDKGIRAIGRGLLTIEDSTVHAAAFVVLRPDYGSTWEGDVVIRNCRWLPGGGETTWPTMISLRNDGRHDFGYPCFMPRTVTVDGLHVDDTNHPDEYSGMYLFSDPEAGSTQGEERLSMAEQPFPYQPCQTVRVRGLTTASGLKPCVSANPELQASLTIRSEETACW